MPLNQGGKKKVCIVLDLDRTLINDMYEPYPGVKSFIDSIISIADYRILWTAGNKEHLFQFLQTPSLFPPNYHLNFIRLLSGLYKDTKSVNIIQDLICNDCDDKRNLIYILIDDSMNRYKDNGYDKVIDVSKYTRVSKINNIEYIEYDNILKDLKNFLNKKSYKVNKKNTSKNMMNNIIDVKKTYKRKRLSSNNGEIEITD